MEQRIFTALAAVRRRQRGQQMIAGFLTGLLVGASVCIGFALILQLAVRLGLPGPDISWLWGLGIPLLSGLLGGGLAALRRRSWQQAAKVVDAYYQLKDRVLTAVQFSSLPERSGLQQLQIQDAVTRLQTIEARSVVPLGRPPRLLPALISVLASVVLMLVPLQPVLSRNPAVVPVNTAVTSEQIARDLQQLEDQIAAAGLEELEQLVQELQSSSQQLQQPDTDLPKALATLSEMQQMLAKRQAELNVAAADAKFQLLGEALENAEEFQGAATALQKGDYAEAAKQLESADPEKLQSREAQVAAEKLAEVAKAMQESGMSRLSEQTSDMADAVREQQATAIREQSRQLAEQVRQQQTRKALAESLQAEAMKLAESKQQIRAGTTNKAGESQQGANTRNVTRGTTNQKSVTSSSSTGGKTAGNIEGEKTKLDSERQIARLSGQLTAEGDSEFETISSDPTSQVAQRQAQETFARYQKLSDAVLDSESLPLGHRQTIRRYFESIRPAGGSVDSEAAVSPE